MTSIMLDIQSLHATIHDTPILRGLNLKVNPGEIHVIMGPNGAGKSTLAKVLGGHPHYSVTGGDILLKGESLLSLAPEERVTKGLFIGFQYPVEIPGVSNFQFLLSSYNSQRKARGDKELSKKEFRTLLQTNMSLMKMKEEFELRNINEGFSGGEKKRNEILQMLLLNPDLAILDETDSGLDIDAMRVVAKGINTFAKDKSKALILVTHYQRLLDHIIPDYVHVMIEGRIVHSSDAKLALELEEKGYDWLIPQNEGA
jgi:Fe-S cluster assembly ATP-binding protein